MKRILSIFAIFALIFSLTSCEDFLTYSPSDGVKTDEAFKTASDISNALNGVYYSLGTYRFYGRNVVALGDIAADNCWMTGSSGHFDPIYQYVINPDNPDLRDIWAYGYWIIDRCTRIIEAAPVVEQKATEQEKKTIKASVAQAHALKALANFTLINIFGLPYNNNNKASQGIILIKDKPIEAFASVSRGSVGETYNLILSEIAAAKKDISLVSFNAFYMNEAALYALESRVNLYMQNWNVALSSAQKALSVSGGKLVEKADVYQKMWADIAPTSEDIFTIGKTADDNLSANALNTLYGSYNGKATSGLVALFGENDMRRPLFKGKGDQTRALKFDGIPSSKATSNIPVFRVPEMYLIIAEAKAQLGQEDAVDYVYSVAKRNPDLKKSDIPTEKKELLKFISVERRRELFQEGHRWYDMRRTGELMTRVGGSYSISNWDVSKFVYPIPASEVNASNLPQTEGWEKNLPK